MANNTQQQTKKTPQQLQQDYYHQMAQQYGMTDDQFQQVVAARSQGQSVPNYGQPTDSFTPERQLSRSGQWTDISPQQNANFNSLQQLNQVGLLPQQPQQQQQTPSLADMWNSYNQLGKQQAQGQQATQTPAPVIPQAAQPAPVTPIASVPSIQGQSPFAPPPPPAPGQQQLQQQRAPADFLLPGYARGGVARGPAVVGERGKEVIIPSGPTQVVPLRDKRSRQQAAGLPHMQQGGTVMPQNQGYTQSPTNAGYTNPDYGYSAIGAAGMGGWPMSINSTPNQGAMSQGGIYSGSQQPTVYGQQTGSAPTQATHGIITLPNGQQLNQSQVALFMQSSPDNQEAIAQGLGSTPAQIMQAANANSAQFGQGVPNAQPQMIASQRNMPPGPQSVMPGPFVGADMPVATINQPGYQGIQPVMPANAAQARPVGPTGQQGVPWAIPPMPGGMGIPPSSVAPPLVPSSQVPGLPPAAPGTMVSFSEGYQPLFGVQPPPMPQRGLSIGSPSNNYGMGPTRLSGATGSGFTTAAGATPPPGAGGAPPSGAAKLPQMASGGITRGPAVVGEQGKELLIPHGGPVSVVPLKGDKAQAASKQLPGLQGGGWADAAGMGDVASTVADLYNQPSPAGGMGQQQWKDLASGIQSSGQSAAKALGNAPGWQMQPSAIPPPAPGAGQQTTKFNPPPNPEGDEPIRGPQIIV